MQSFHPSIHHPCMSPYLVFVTQMKTWPPPCRRLYFVADRVIELTSDMFKQPRKHGEHRGWEGPVTLRS